MLNNLFKLTAATFIWKKYKSTILSTIVLVIYFWLIGIIHQDYLSYREIEGPGENLGLSFLLKWLAWLGGIVFYFLYDNIGSRSNSNVDQIDSGNSTKHSKSSVKNTSPNSNDIQDPFSSIRKKKKLRSKADIIIEKRK